MNTTIISPQDSHLGLFNTTSGKLIDIAHPLEEQICIKDIAHALSNICRFGGHAKPFYSVAQHSVMVAYLVPMEYKKHALMHDASEAYLGDVIKPLKNIIGTAYTKLEKSFTNVINYRFDLLPGRDAAIAAEEVKKADMAMLHIEHEALILDKPAKLAAFMHDHNLDMFGWAWQPSDAEQLFLATFEKLFGPEMMQ